MRMPRGVHPFDGEMILNNKTKQKKTCMILSPWRAGDKIFSSPSSRRRGLRVGHEQIRIISNLWPFLGGDRQCW